MEYFNVLILPKWYPFHIPREKTAPLLYLKDKAKQKISYNQYIFPGLSVVLVQLLKGCTNCYVVRVVISA